MVLSLPVIAPFTFPCSIFLLAHLHGTLGRHHIFPVPGVLQSFSLNLDVNPVPSLPLCRLELGL